MKLIQSSMQEESVLWESIRCRPTEILSWRCYLKRRYSITITVGKILQYMKEAVELKESFAHLPADPSAQIISDFVVVGQTLCFGTITPISKWLHGEKSWGSRGRGKWRTLWWQYRWFICRPSSLDMLDLERRTEDPSELLSSGTRVQFDSGKYFSIIAKFSTLPKRTRVKIMT